MQFYQRHGLHEAPSRANTTPPASVADAQGDIGAEVAETVGAGSASMTR
jgi:hypothetical protein